MRLCLERSACVPPQDSCQLPRLLFVLPKCSALLVPGAFNYCLILRLGWNWTRKGEGCLNLWPTYFFHLFLAPLTPPSLDPSSRHDCRTRIWIQLPLGSKVGLLAGWHRPGPACCGITPNPALGFSSKYTISKGLLWQLHLGHTNCTFQEHLDYLGVSGNKKMIVMGYLAR